MSEGKENVQKNLKTKKKKKRQKIGRPVSSTLTRMYLCTYIILLAIKDDEKIRVSKLDYMNRERDKKGKGKDKKRIIVNNKPISTGS